MKRCSKHYWFEYDETQGGCQLCEREALKARAAPAIVEPAMAAPSEPAMALPPAPFVETVPPEPAGDILPPVTLEQRDSPADEMGLAAGAWPPEQTSPAAADLPAEAAPAPSEPLGDEDTRILNQLTRLRENGVFTVVLIGFYAGGKTWFLNRVKHELRNRGFNVSPAPPEDGERVVRTFNVEIHHIRRLRDEAVRSFALIDIPGERLTRLVAKDFRSVRSVLSALDMCGALIVALPADEVLLSEDVQREAKRVGGVDQLLLRRTADDPALHQLATRARELVIETGSVEEALGLQGLKAGEVEQIRAAGEAKSADDRQRLLKLTHDLEALDMLSRVYRLAEADAELTLFTQDLCFMTGLMSKLKQAGVPIDANYDFGGIDAAEIDMHISTTTYSRFTRPTFVAMTKADLVSHPDPLLEALIKHSRKADVGLEFDTDPLDTVRDMRTSLAFMFEQWFGTVKFDFVSAFHQHRHGDTIDYGAGHFGVNAVFNWISWARRWDSQTRREHAALRRARAIRKSRDGIDEPLEFDFATSLAARR